MDNLGFFTRAGEPVRNLSTDSSGKRWTGVFIRCDRCGGQGGAEQWKFTGWTCYKCGGARGWNGQARAYTQEQLDKLNATKAKRDAGRMAKAQAKIAAEASRRAVEVDAFMAVHGDLVRRAQALTGRSNFLSDLVAKLETWLWSPAQVAAVDKVVAQIEQQNAARAASGHVGTVGERLELAVTVERVFSFERAKFNAHWLTEQCHIVTMRDAAGNAIVTKGRFIATKGEAFTLRATVKEHAEYKGEKQTTVQRATVLTPK